ncbi:MAG TPA: HAD family hydrolase [Ohtaekwangia sp.]
MSRNLALFDFDGTITRKDTFLVFIRYCVGDTRYAMGFLVLSPVLVMYKLKLIPNWRAKEIVFSYFFKGVSDEQFKTWGKAFAEKVIPGLIRPSALKAIQDHRAKSDRVIVVTASSSAWIKGWTDSLGLELLATEWAIDKDGITGRLTGKNCYGMEKRNRIVNHLDLKEYPVISVYGDTSGDKEMLELGTHRHYRFFTD